jgi:hypothetical protein
MPTDTVRGLLALKLQMGVLLAPCRAPNSAKQ